MEQEGKPKKKKLLMEIVALKRDVHKYHTLYEKQKEYCEDKVQELTMMESKQREIEHKFHAQEMEIERLYSENLELVKIIEMKNQELETKKTELNSIIKSYQELSKILLLVDKHLQFLETENFVDSKALQSTVQDAPIDTKNKNKSSSKVPMETEFNYPGVDKGILTSEGLMACWEAGISHCRLTSLEVEKERLSRLLNHPQMGGAKSDSINIANNNISREAEQLLKNSSVIWSTLEGTNANSVSTKDLIDKFREKLHHYQCSLKKDREKNKNCKEELIKLTEKLQADLENTLGDLEALKSQDKALQEHLKGLEIENEKLQQEMKIKAEDIETRNQAIKALSIQNNQLKEAHSKKEKEIKMLIEKFKTMEFVNKTRNKMYEDKLIQLMSSSNKSKNQCKLKSKMVQTDPTQERIISDVSKYQLILTVQELLKKLIDKTDEVIQLETQLKKKCLFVKNLVIESIEKSKKECSRPGSKERKSCLYQKDSPCCKHNLTESDSYDYDSTEDEASLTSQDPEEFCNTHKPNRYFNTDQNESTYRSNLEKSLNYNSYYHHPFYKDSVENYMLKSKAVKDRQMHREACHRLSETESIPEDYQVDDAKESSSTLLDFRNREPHPRHKELNKNETDCRHKIQCSDKMSGHSTDEAKRSVPNPKRRTSMRQNVPTQAQSDRPVCPTAAQTPRTKRRSTQPSRSLHSERSPSDNLDTMDELAESTDQEPNCSQRKIGQEISKFLKQQSLEVNRSQQNNSSNMLRNAEFYVILKGHRKNSS